LYPFVKNGLIPAIDGPAVSLGLSQLTAKILTGFA
jgi:hypothetical protein